MSFLCICMQPQNICRLYNSHTHNQPQQKYHIPYFFLLCIIPSLFFFTSQITILLRLLHTRRPSSLLFLLLWRTTIKIMEFLCFMYSKMSVVSSNNRKKKALIFFHGGWWWFGGRDSRNVMYQSQLRSQERKKSIIFIFPCVENNAIKNNNANTFPNRKTLNWEN